MAVPAKSTVDTRRRERTLRAEIPACFIESSPMYFLYLMGNCLGLIYLSTCIAYLYNFNCPTNIIYHIEIWLRSGGQPPLRRHLDVAAMDWDMELNDPNLKHLGISRKDLRTGPETGERTFLSLILPQASPQDGKGPQEIHPVVEEAYVISGALTGPQGTMYPGAYFWRPPGIAHGPFGSRRGSVSLIRFVGGKHVNIWTEEQAPFRYDAPYNPIFPDELKLFGAAGCAPPRVY